MLLELGVHGGREQELDLRLGLVDCRCVNVLLSSILHVALNALFNFHDEFAGQVGKQLDCFLLPANASIRLEEVRDIVVCGLRYRAFENLTIFDTAEVGIILSDEDFIKTQTANDRSLRALFQ